MADMTSIPKTMTIIWVSFQCHTRSIPCMLCNTCLIVVALLQSASKEANSSIVMLALSMAEDWSMVFRRQALGEDNEQQGRGLLEEAWIVIVQLIARSLQCYRAAVIPCRLTC